MLVCCTGGEAGDILNPAMDTDEVQADIAAIRRQELARPPRSSATTRWSCSATATRACPAPPRTPTPVASPTPTSTRPSAGWSPSSAGAAAGGRHLPRRSRRLPHPDHLRVHDITVAAVRAAADDRLPRGRRAVARRSSSTTRSGPAARSLATHEAFLELGLESPFEPSVVRAAVAGRPHHHADRRRRVYAGERRPPAGPRHPDRSRARRSGSACPTTSPRRCTPGRSTTSPAPLGDQSSPRTTCSPGPRDAYDAAGEPWTTARARGEYLTQEWLDVRRSWPPSSRRPRRQRSQYVVTGRPDGDARLHGHRGRQAGRGASLGTDRRRVHPDARPTTTP